MNKRCLLICSSLLICFFALAQQEERVASNLYLSSSENKQVIDGEIPLFQDPPFFSYFIEYPEGDLTLKIRFSKHGDIWTNWTELKQDEHNHEKNISQLYFGDATIKYYQLEVTQSKVPAPFIKLHFFNPGQSRPISNTQASSSARDLFACPCPMPSFQDRNDWCSTSDCPEHPSPEITQVSHLIIHHSAGSNTSNDWAATVRAIWDFHVNGNNWSDIGYNWLIDPNGIVYQGREDNILGAHFCAQNGQTMGICMLGTFTDISPSTEALTSLEQLLAWKSCDRNIDPLTSNLHPSSGLTLPNISGHRDGCNTACPGDTFYPTIPDVRQGVADLIENQCAAVSTNNVRLNEESLVFLSNPINELLAFQYETLLEGDLHWQIVNIQQQQLLNGISVKKGNLYEERITVDKLAAGIYFLRLSIGDKKGVWKIIKISS